MAPSIQLWTDADLRLIQTEHEAIFDALKCGDAEAAASAARAHLTSLRRRIMHGILSEQACYVLSVSCLAGFDPCDHLPPPKSAAADRPAG